MQDHKTTMLARVFSDVLANLAFMFSDDEPTVPPPGNVWLESRISFDGPVAGTLQLRCTRQFSIQLASNLLGSDPETDESANDAVKEFMNIVCGQFITSEHGTEDVFNVTIPEITELDDYTERRMCEVIETCIVSVDGHFVELSHLAKRAPSDVQACRK